MFLVQFVQLGRLLRGIGQQLAHFVLHVDPARGQDVHFDNRIAAIIFVGYQSAAFFWLRGRVGEAVITWLFGWVVREGLAIGYVPGG